MEKLTDPLRVRLLTLRCERTNTFEFAIAARKPMHYIRAAIRIHALHRLACT